MLTCGSECCRKSIVSGTIGKLCEYFEISLMNVDFLRYKDIETRLSGSDNTIRNVKYVIIDRFYGYNNYIYKVSK